MRSYLFRNPPQKVFCVLRFNRCNSVIYYQSDFRRTYGTEISIVFKAFDVGIKCSKKVDRKFAGTETLRNCRKRRACSIKFTEVYTSCRSKVSGPSSSDLLACSTTVDWHTQMAIIWFFNKTEHHPHGMLEVCRYLNGELRQRCIGRKGHNTFGDSSLAITFPGSRSVWFLFMGQKKMFLYHHYLQIWKNSKPGLQTLWIPWRNTYGQPRFGGIWIDVCRAAYRGHIEHS